MQKSASANLSSISGPAVVVCYLLLAAGVGQARDNRPADLRKNSNVEADAKPDTKPDDPKGKTIPLQGGQLFIPDSLERGRGAYDLLIHFHGDLALTRRQFVAAQMPGVLLVVNYRGLSGAYSKPFEDRDRFANLLRETSATLVKQGVVAKGAKLNRLCLSSFSAGYGAVRQILRHDAYFKRIDGLVLADSLYAGFVGDAAQRKVNPAHMQVFRRFIDAAVKGDKRFILTHSMLPTPRYASTVETADDLLRHAGLERRTVNETLPGGLHAISRAAKADFQLIACAGRDGKAHMQHLQQIGQWWRLLKAK